EVSRALDSRFRGGDGTWFDSTGPEETDGRAAVPDPSYRRRRSPAEHAHDERDGKDHQEDEEQYLRDASGRRRHATKAEKAGNQCDHQKNKSPIKHGYSPFAILPEETDTNSWADLPR